MARRSDGGTADPLIATPPGATKPSASPFAGVADRRGRFVSVPDEGASADQAQPRAPQNPGFIELFLMFSQLGLSSFGGGLPAWMHRAFVQRRRWLGETEFYAALALARFMPGVNAVNLAVLIGQRLGGFSGATAAAIGLLVGPSLAVIGLAILYRQFGGTIIIDRVLEGAAMSTVGLLIGMGAKV